MRLYRCQFRSGPQPGTATRSLTGRRANQRPGGTGVSPVPNEAKDLALPIYLPIEHRGTIFGYQPLVHTPNPIARKSRGYGKGLVAPRLPVEGVTEFTIAK